MRRAILATVFGALGILVIPSSALAETNCNYTTSQTTRSDNSFGAIEIVVYADADGNSGVTDSAATAAGVCADNLPLAGLGGGYAEVGAGEDPATGAADPGIVGGQPDAYVVFDGDDANTPPADGYVGISNYETGASRTDQALCTSTGSDNGAVGSSNSGGCVGAAAVGWLYVPGDAPTPVCGSNSGDAWDGSGIGSPNKRDGYDFGTSCL